MRRTAFVWLLLSLVGLHTWPAGLAARDSSSSGNSAADGTETDSRSERLAFFSTTFSPLLNLFRSSDEDAAFDNNKEVDDPSSETDSEVPNVSAASPAVGILGDEKDRTEGSEKPSEELYALGHSSKRERPWERDAISLHSKPRVSLSSEGNKEQKTGKIDGKELQKPRVKDSKTKKKRKLRKYKKQRSTEENKRSSKTISGSDGTAKLEDVTAVSATLQPFAKLSKTARQANSDTVYQNSTESLLRKISGAKSFLPADSPEVGLSKSDNASDMAMSDYPPAAYNIRELAQYMRTCDNCMVHWDASSTCPMHNIAMDLKACMIQLTDRLSSGCQPDENCSDGKKCCVNRNPALEGAAKQLIDAARQMYDMLQSSCSSCPVAGGWSGWTEWSACSVTCGHGTSSRYRPCNNPAPKVGGQPCQGPSREMRSCSGPAQCCTDGQWSGWTSWGRCSATCGTGRQERYRKCSNPSPSYCGRTCPGPNIDIQSCGSVNPCCIDGNWGPWERWGGCSTTCGHGRQTRMRRCDNPTPNYCGRRCHGSSMEVQQCNNDVPCCDAHMGRLQRDGSLNANEKNRVILQSVERQQIAARSDITMFYVYTVPADTEHTVDGNWGHWQSWTQCSASCGSGYRDRRRYCDSPRPNYCGRHCYGLDFERAPCHAIPCPIICLPRNGQWSPWNSWTACSTTCGSGVRARSRRCDQPEPNTCGIPCSGYPYDRENCNQGPCCVNGGWSAWSSWTQVSVSCGVGLRQHRRRCDNPTPNVCGTSCPGSDVESDYYDTRIPCAPVCVNGGWSAWSSWTQVSVSCGVGLRQHRRRCDNPTPNVCGTSCPGSDVESDYYDTRIPCAPVCAPRDGNWSPWSSWPACSVSCGTGTRSRQRTCTHPSPNECGRTCDGLDRDVERCRGLECCVDGNWAQWSEWGPCSSTCGAGLQHRERRCSPMPNHCGEPCHGPSRDTRRCYERECCEPRDGNWSPWTPWSSCSATCGSGTRDRSRGCVNPAPNECGQSCPGSAVESSSCFTDRCCEPRDGSWSPWTPWTSCSVTCGSGTRDRSRGCDNPSPNECGRSCPGSVLESTSCFARACCEPRDGNWSPWSPWTSCSVTCGSGTRDRSRDCDNPSPNECGRSCSGLALESANCFARACCEPGDGSWSPWTHWSSCSVTCGSGTRARSRHCDNPSPDGCGRSCLGSALESISCFAGTCCVSQETGYMAATTEESVRSCLGCVGESISSFSEPSCSNTFTKAPRDGNWGPWSSWSSCSSTCGSGLRERSRVCNNPSPNECGQSCSGSARESFSCDQGPCCVDGNWGPWGMWSRPSATCGTAVRQRHRQCNNPSPNYCGRPCPGQSEDRETYDTRIPCIICERSIWTSWESWGKCSVSCGLGQELRRRRCNFRSPDCPAHCSGPETDSRACDLRPCCVEQGWSSWGAWSPCYPECGNGERTRRRMCEPLSAGRPCENSCPGSSQERSRCLDLPACQQAWSQWSSCSATCAGSGLRERSRETLPGAGGGIGGRQIEREVCQVFSPPCREQATWSQWEDWCPCDCRQGVRSRRRKCQGVDPSGPRGDVSINRCGPGDAREEEYCDIRLSCPTCVTDCSGREDGDYPSCVSCSDYVTCTRGQAQTSACGRGDYEWDAFIRKCVDPPSPSCTLASCISSCRDKSDGFYPSCMECNTYVECRNGLEQERRCPDEQEFNAHLRRCESGPSPTCMRSIRRNFELGPLNDAPADSYFSTKDIASDPERKQLYIELRVKVGVAAKFNRTHEDILGRWKESQDEEKKRTTEMKSTVNKEKMESAGEPGSQGNSVKFKLVSKTRHFQCHKDCSGLEAGLYQSCKSCHFYLMCTKHAAAREVKCPLNMFWDDKRKKCKFHSLTCKSEVWKNLVTSP